MNKLGLFLIGLNILITIGSLALGFKLDNMLFAFIIGFLVVMGMTFAGSILKIAVELSLAFQQSSNILYIIKNGLSIFNSFDIFIVIGQLVFYLLIVLKNPGIFNSLEIPDFKTKPTFILSIAAQITMTILRNVMKVELFGEITILIGIITAFLVYDIKTDIEKKKVDKYSYK